MNEPEESISAAAPPDSRNGADGGQFAGGRQRLPAAATTCLVEERPHLDSASPWFVGIGEAAAPEAAGPQDCGATALRRFCVSTLSSLDKIAARMGLNSAQWFTLRTLALTGDTTATVLAALLRHDKGSMTRLIDGLERRKLLARSRSSGDRRLVTVKILPLGRLYVEQLEAGLTLLLKSTTLPG